MPQADPDMRKIRAFGSIEECMLEGLRWEPSNICSCEQEIPYFYRTQILLHFLQK